ncbi:MAG: ADP compounds hydrolase NudE [Gammaproteobacteria bacterium]|nr:ADP compounds hydrolase NudE [Gammaproteobacteria bacterium]
MQKKPEILDSRILPPEEIRVRIEELHLRFGNGAERHYRRMKTKTQSVVLIVPMLDDDTVLLIREYAAGLHNYQLQLPKGAVDPGEEILSAANRELKEEVGKGANKLQHINSFTALPGFNTQITEVVLAQDLYDEKLEGDEPEEIEVIPWSLNNLTELVEREDCTEGRSIAALYYVKDLLMKQKV